VFQFFLLEWSVNKNYLFGIYLHALLVIHLLLLLLFCASKTNFKLHASISHRNLLRVDGTELEKTITVLRERKALQNQSVINKRLYTNC